MPNSEVRWMNSRRGIPSSSAALPLETRLRRYNSNTIISRAVCPIGWPRVARKPLRSSPRSRVVESITDAPSSWYRSLRGAENTSVERRSMKLGNQETLGVKANYLASPPLVVAYALAGTRAIPSPATTSPPPGLTGAETYHIEGLATSLSGGGRTATVRAVKADGTEIAFTAVVRVDTPQEVEYYRNGGILPYVLRQLAV